MFGICLHSPAAVLGANISVACGGNVRQMSPLAASADFMSAVCKFFVSTPGHVWFAPPATAAQEKLEQDFRQPQTCAGLPEKRVLFRCKAAQVLGAFLRHLRVALQADVFRPHAAAALGGSGGAAAIFAAHPLALLGL